MPVLAPRGRILDREGRTIVDNYPSFTALLLRDSSRDLAADADLIAQGLHLDPNEVRTRIRRFASMPQYQPIFLKEDITPDELQFIEAHRNELPELDTIMAHRRLYPRNGFMAHVIGYVGEVSEDMLNQPQFELYNPGDVVGISGVERQYNTMLMGTERLAPGAGRQPWHAKSDASAKPKPIPGKPLKLTIDIDLQIAAEEALEGKNGAIVAMDPHTGEILAMVSGPTFDPNDFAVRVSRDEWNKLVTDPDKPLLNKAIQAQLAPGSTFKIIMSVAGWQEGIAQDTSRELCTVRREFYGRCFRCWVKGADHGPVDLEKAIYQSCDVFFYTLAEKLGIDRIAKYATDFGLGRRPASIFRTKSAASCLRKNGRSGTSSRSGSLAKRFRSASARARSQSLRCNCCARSARFRWAAAWSFRTSSIQRMFRQASSRRRTFTEVKSIPIDSERMELHHRFDVACAVAGRYGAFGAHSGN